MISEKQKQAICNTLGKKYSPSIIAYLKTKRIRPLKSKKFSSQIIQDIVNGRQENIVVELAIVKLVNIVKAEKEEAEKTLESLL